MITNKLDKILEKFNNVKKTSNGYKVQCPCHNDKNPSLDITCKGGNILMHCHAGCKTEDILERVNLSMKDLFIENEWQNNNNNSQSQVSCYYVYQNEKGEPLYRKVRYVPKKFAFERFENGTWKLGIKGARRVLYNLPEVLKGISNKETIYIVEGEKDVETLKKNKKIATCSAFGAGNDKWDKNCNSIFRDVNIIIQDNDDIGKSFAKNIAMSLYDVAKSVKLIDLSKIWPDIPEHGDISDFLENHTIDKLEKLISDTAPYRNTGIFEETSYFWDDGNFQMHSDTGSKYLGNFYLKVNKEIIRDNGITTEKLYELEPIIKGAQLAPRIIPAKSLNNLNFITNFWGLILRPAIIYNIDKFYIDSLRAQYKNIPCITIFSHTGWEKIDGKWFFLYSGGAVGDVNIENNSIKNDTYVELEPKLSGYCLNTPIETEFNIEVINKLFDLAPSEIIYPLIGFVFLTPLNEFMRKTEIEPSFILYLLGETGSKKSTIAALFLSFFGNFNNKDLPSSFKDTANSLERQGALLKDVVTVIDDFHPAASSKEANLMNTTAQRLVRMYGDRTGKSRLNSDCSSKVSYPPKGNAICTGEDLPDIGQSGLGRLFIVELNKESLDNEVLSYLQKNTGVFTCFMRKYIEWLIPKIDGLGTALYDEFINLRDSVNQKNIHGRIPETIAHLQIGVNMFYAFIRDLAEEPSTKVLAMKKGAFFKFKRLAENQAKIMGLCDPIDMFISGIKTLLATNEFEISESKSSKYYSINGQDGTLIGYLDKEYYYLIFSQAYSKVYEFLKKQGEHFPVHKNTLLQRLRKKSYIDPNPSSGENTCSKSFEPGKKIRCVRLFRNYIDG